MWATILGQLPRLSAKCRALKGDKHKLDENQIYPFANIADLMYELCQGSLQTASPSETSIAPRYNCHTTLEDRARSIPITESTHAQTGQAHL